MRYWILLCLLCLSACGGVAWNTTVADHPQVRSAMLASVVPGETTEKRFVARWGNPTQKIREGGQVSYVYRNMRNPQGYYVPQFGNSGAYVVVNFQYGLAIGAYSSDTEGCRATFPPRPPGPGFDNPSTVHAVNCGVRYTGASERRPIAEGMEWLGEQARGTADAIENRMGGTPSTPKAPNPMMTPGVPADTYQGNLK